MGCSVSRPANLLAGGPIEDKPSNSPISSPFYSKTDTDHVVSLTSTTYGSIIIIDPVRNPDDPKEEKPSSSSPHSVINTWELMEGLDDDFDFDFVHKPSPSQNSPAISSDPFVNDAESFEIVEELPNSKPLWKHLSEESLLAKMDPNVVSSYRRALHLKQIGGNRDKKTPSVVSHIYLAGCEDRIVVYHTSLRGIRRTYEDCCAVRMILKGFQVSVDERDVSMDSSYKEEVQSALGEKSVSLPQVFVGGKYIGGAEKIKQLHECGELAKLLEGLSVVCHGVDICESCGDVRFVPCRRCNGSRKVFEEVEGKMRKCIDCNENGLIRCPICCNI